MLDLFFFVSISAQRELLEKFLNKNSDRSLVNFDLLNYLIEFAKGNPRQLVVINDENFSAVPSNLHEVCRYFRK